MNLDRRDFLAALSGAAALSALKIQADPRAALDSAQISELASDPRRPQFHLLAAANWMNDPNGLIYWNGSYHMFYQYNPKAADWGNMHWGHAVSKDMVHWKNVPIALSPTPGGPDADGCWTGTALVQDGHVALLYTGVQAALEDEATIKNGALSLRETQCVASATDPDLKTWSKIQSPLILAPPRELDVNGFRDPSPWRMGDWWYTVIGSGVINRGGAILLYRSKDCRRWEYIRILIHRDWDGDGKFDPFDPQEVWERPEFFPLGDRYVLSYSAQGKAFWRSGKLDTEGMFFRVEQSGILDYGSFYAPKTQLDESGNRIIWGWIQEARAPAEYRAAGWAGLMSLPRLLTLGIDGRIRISVATQVDQLRGREQSFGPNAAEGDQQQWIGSMGLKNCCGEIRCLARSVREFKLTLLGSAPSATPWLTIKYDPLKTNRISIDSRSVPVLLSEHEDIDLHFYVDSSVIEVFVNGQAALTKRFYYHGSISQDLHMQWAGRTGDIVSLSAWPLTPISPDRLTT